jgi:DNA-binding MarR family transcriptional regulator
VEPDAVASEERITDCLNADAAGPAGPAGPADLTGMDEAARRKVLVSQAAQFSMAFARWTDMACSDGLSYQQLRLLDRLRSHGPAIMREIGGELGISPRNMTAMVDALEQADMVVRRPHPSDRRATLIELTPDGITTAQKSLDPRLDAIAGVFASLSVEEQQRLYAALAQVMDAMGPPPGAC